MAKKKAKKRPAMQRFASHKEVSAFKIAQILNTTRGTILRSVGVARQAQEVLVDKQYVLKHNPQVGGYYVKYADGYESWSPATAFEEGYSEIPVKEYTNNGEPIEDPTTPSDSVIEKYAMAAYAIYRAAKPRARIMGKPLPTVKVLFKQKKYRKYADEWLNAAAEVELP